MPGSEAVVATVVVVTWANVGGLQGCLDALEAQSLPRASYRVLVVDNGSSDGTAALLERWNAVTAGPSEVLRLPANRGFAGGVAAALDRVAGGVAVLVNDDALAAPGFLAALLAGFGGAGPGAGRVGAVTGLVVLADPLAPAGAPHRAAETGVQLDNAGLPFVAAGDPRAAGAPLVRVNSTGNEVRRDGNAQDRDWLRPLDPPPGGGPSPRLSAPEVFGFCGAAAALWMPAVREAGGMDADLFLYWEDTDLSWRLRRAGWTVRYAPEAVAVHAHAASSRSGSPVFRFHNERNRLVVLTRHAPARLVAVALGRYLVRTALVAARGPRSLLPLRGRVLASYARRLPRLVRERRALDRRSPVGRAEVARLVVPVPDQGPGPQH